MRFQEIARLALYVVAAVAAAVVGVAAYVRGDTETTWVALGWIVTNVIAIPNVPRTAVVEEDSGPGDHAA